MYRVGHDPSSILPAERCQGRSRGVHPRIPACPSCASFLNPLQVALLSRSGRPLQSPHSTRLRFATQNTCNAVKVFVIAQDLGRSTPFHVGDVIGIDVVNR